MNSTQIPYDSYAYKPNPMQTQYRQINTFSRTQGPVYPRPGAYVAQNPSSGEASKTIIFVVLGILIVGIVVWVVINFLLYKDDKAWFKVYKAPPPPSGSVQPNGDGTGGALDPAVTTFKNAQLTGYKAGNPSSTPSDFGGYITTPT
jgi:hypothetical protein